MTDRFTTATVEPTRPADPSDGGAQTRAARPMSALARLLAERPDLRGVHAPADLADDAIRWCA